MKKNCRKIILTVVITVLLLILTSCSSPLFQDVAEDSLYYNDIKAVYDWGFMTHKEENFFAPNASVTYAELVEIAANLHQIKTASAPVAETEGRWYQPYVDYCKENGIINKDYNWDESVSRAEFIDIFSRVATVNDLKAFNNIEDGAIPDVSEDSDYYDSIYKFYRAGIFQGVDELYNCKPDGLIRRYEIACVINRIMNPSVRYSIELIAEKDVVDVGDIFDQGSSTVDNSGNSIDQGSEIPNNTPDQNITDTDPVAPNVPVSPEEPEVPVTPSEPVPTEPEVPETPSVPVTPNVPTEPEVPETPSVPVTPNVPTEPEVPETPSVPVTPNVPTEPEVPVTPSVPVTPNVPTEPEEPETPSVPVTPNVPAEPVVPETPSVSVTPNVPTEPEVPVTPSVPVTPNVPEESEVPVTPSVPVTPENPTEPEVPVTPSEPETPDVPTEPEVTEEPTEPEVPDEPQVPVVPETPVVPEEPEDSTGDGDFWFPGFFDKPTEPEEPEEPETPSQGTDNNEQLDLVAKNTPLGVLYYPSRSEPYISTSSMEETTNGYKGDVFCKTSSGTVKIYTLYMGFGLTNGSHLGYMEFFEVRMEKHSPSLDGWSEADKEIYNMVQSDYGYVVDQVRNMLD
ncbi:MAG: S-layer homology domain-containing protein [Clostridia bacterium]|nr:S-layer homology domain-containing protein [Clostridia bacterium]